MKIFFNAKLVFGFLMLALVYSCNDDCPVDTPPEEDLLTDKLQIAWDDYYKTIDTVTQQFYSSETYQLDSIHQVGATELLSMLIASNMDLILQNQDYPNFRHMEDPTRRIGIDNPDNYYRSANLWNPDGEHVYRVWGNRGTTADFLMETFYGPDPQGAIAVLEDEDMVLDGNGDFEVYLSAVREEYMDNWMELKEDSLIYMIIVRSNFAEWDKEVHGDVFIEKIGTSGVPTTPTTKEDIIRRIDNARQVLSRQGIFWPEFAAKMTVIPPNKLIKFTTTGEIGILTQKSSYGHFDLQDDEALIVKLPETDAEYCGFQTANFWGSSPDWRNQFSSITWGRNGKCQAYKNSDGNYYIVLSKYDPGVQNWVETSGIKKGILALRLQSLKDLSISVTPGTELVKLSEVKSKLPADTPDFTPEQRTEQLKIRQQYALERYIYW